MSGLEYFRIGGYLLNDVNGGISTEMKANQQFPTAPMYMDTETYNGRCAVWLKRVSLGGTQRLIEMRGLLKDAQCAIVFRGANCLNQVHLPVANGGLMPDGNGADVMGVGHRFNVALGGTGFPAVFRFSPNRDHLEAIAADIIATDKGTFSADRVIEAAATGHDGSGVKAPAVNAPATNFVYDNNKYFTTYENDNVGNMADALIVGNLWGANLEVELMFGDKGEYTAGRFKPASNLKDDIFYEFVVKPLSNEPKQSNPNGKD